MPDKISQWQTPVSKRNGGLLFLGLFAVLVGIGFAVLTWGNSGLWVFFAEGNLALVWVTWVLVITLGLALPNWVPPALPKRAVYGAALLPMLFAIGVLQGFANSADEYAYLFQAKTYLSGHLWNPAPDLGQALAADYTWVKDGKWAGQYPPGWPGILALFNWSGLPTWLVNPLLGLAIIAALRRLGLATNGALLVMASSPFFIFNAASYHSHLAAGLLGILAVLCLEMALAHKSKWGWALAAGLAVGGVGLVRYLSAALIAAPFALGVIRKRRWGILVCVILGIAPCIALLLWYHSSITGDPFKPVYWMGGRTADHLYFDPVGRSEGFRISGWRWVELVEWAGPGLVLVWLGVLIGKIRQRKLNAVDWVMPIFVLVFLFYPFDGANRYGPRYYFEAFPFLILSLNGVNFGPMAKRLLSLSLVYNLVALPFLAGFYRQIVTERMDLYAQVESQGLSNSVVLVKDGPGRLWKMEPDDMARNGLNADGPVLYARADRIDVAGLHDAFPDRQVWVYECPDRCRLRQD